MSICGWVFNATPCPPSPPTADPLYLIDGPQASGCGGKASGISLREVQDRFMCTCVFEASLACPSQNTWSALRIVNATADLAYIEFRPHASPLARASTNWTELYDLRADPWQAVNLCVRKWWGLWDNAGAARPMIAALLPLRVPHSQQGAAHDPRRARPIE